MQITDVILEELINYLISNSNEMNNPQLFTHSFTLPQSGLIVGVSFSSSAGRGDIKETRHVRGFVDDYMLFHFKMDELTGDPFPLIKRIKDQLKKKGADSLVDGIKSLLTEATEGAIINPGGDCRFYKYKGKVVLLHGKAPAAELNVSLFPGWVNVLATTIAKCIVDKDAKMGIYNIPKSESIKA